MTKDLRKEKPKGTSIRLPPDILEKVEQIQLRERIDRTTVIVKAVEYWVSVDGKATIDGEYITRMDKADKRIVELNEKIDTEKTEIAALKKSIEELKELSIKQTTTIEFLMNKILDRK